MHENLIDRIQALERSLRQWRTMAVVLAVVLLSLLTTGLGFYALEHLHDRQAMQEAVRQEAVARQRFEAARRHQQDALRNKK